MAGVPQGKKRENSLVVILGPTASGKSDLGVRLTKEFRGEIISADSRQVYKGLDIGTGKMRKKEMRGVPHHLLDVSSLRRPYTVSAWRRKALKAIDLIRKRGRIPFLVGGSPLYLYALIDQWSIPEVRSDAKLRQRLERLSLPVLLAKLTRIDPARASSIDPRNKRRVIRAIEIVKKTKRPVPSLTKSPLPYPILFLGINQKNLKRRIAKRLDIMIRRNLLGEVKKLRAQGLSWKRIDELGFEYRFAAAFLRKELSKDEMKRNIQKATEDFARRQMLWFKKDRRVRWIKNYKQAESLTKTFLKN
ncbi:MAG: tRNA (adenosine(37)-N6)-dimethylallyltransferase MiaA [Parcubacteria group bacterium]|nr:tRNA (adenosine(37)-N6)-dimethylallyltransferase MiaA [Parcubacteria group bacterium]